MTKKRPPSGRTLIPLVGAAMAAVAAGSLVLFSVFAQRTALTPGSRGFVIPHAAPAEQHEVVTVPTPRKRVQTNHANENSRQPAFVEDAIAQAGPVAEDSAPPSPDEPVIVASVDVGVPVRDEDEQPRFSRPTIRFARNLDPPGPEEPDEDDEPDEDPPTEDSAENPPTEDPPTDGPTEEPSTEVDVTLWDEEDSDEEGPAPQEREEDTASGSGSHD